MFRVRVTYVAGGKPDTSEQVATLVRFLADDDSSHITGAVIYFDGAESRLIG